MQPIISTEKKKGITREQFKQMASYELQQLQSQIEEMNEFIVN